MPNKRGRGDFGRKTLLNKEEKMPNKRVGWNTSLNSVKGQPNKRVGTHAIGIKQKKL